MRVNWCFNQEMIITQLNIIIRIKWMLLARSMTHVRCHSYKRLRGYLEYARENFLSILSPSLAFDISDVVFSCFKLAAPTPCRAQGEG
jgi:hypothetical protein